MAAIAAAEAGAQVCIVERSERLGQSLLRTGNGRCNLSNLSLDTPEAAAAYNHPDFVAPLLARFTCTRAVELFSQLGLETHADRSGRIYPLSNSAASVLQVLRNRVEHRGVELLTDTEVTAVDSSALAIHPLRLRAKKLILATGNDRLATQVGAHSSIPWRPILGPLGVSGDLKGLSGVRTHCRARLISKPNESIIATQTGELLFKDKALSGIMIFELSRHAACGDLLSLNLVPNHHEDSLQELLAARRQHLASYSARQFLDGLVHPRLALAVLRAASVSSGASATAIDLRQLATALTDMRFTVRELPKRHQAQVLRGGLDTHNFDPYTMMSRHSQGFYACGEALDIDGATGGFNLHFAWASGWRAGRHAAANLGWRELT
jgi:predicted Rossmann fold flavoprotein